MQGADPSLAYRPNLDKNEAKEKEEYRNFEVSIYSLSLWHLFNATIVYGQRNKFKDDKNIITVMRA